MVIPVRVHADPVLVDVLVVVAAGCVPVAVAGQALAGVPGGAGAPLALVEHRAAPLAVRAARVVAALALGVLKWTGAAVRCLFSDYSVEGG